MKEVKKILKVINRFIIVLLIIIVMLIGAVFVQTIINPDKVPDIFGYKPFIVLSGSMETEIYTGDLAIVKIIDASKLEENDIIAFKDEEGYVVTHRIVDVIEKDGRKEFVTKGDNNNTEDYGTVKLDRVEGKYVFKIDGFGNVLLTMKKPQTLIVTIILIIISGVLWIVLDNSKLSKEEKEELEQFRKERQEGKK